MAITKERKKELLKEWEERVSSSENIFVVFYQGLKADEINKVRIELRKEEGELKVIKNRLFKRVLKGKEGISALENFVDGPTGVVFTSQDGLNILKKLFSLKKEFPSLEVHGGLIEGSIFGGDDAEYLSSLPSKEIMMSKLLYAMQFPVIEMKYLLESILRNFVVLLGNLANKRREEEENGKKVK